MARDLFHNNVKTALQKDGWNIIHDPYQLRYGVADVYIDLAAEEAIAAEKEGRKIATVIERYEVRLIIYSPNQEVIDRWIE
jgi:XisH protein